MEKRISFAKFLKEEPRETWYELFKDYIIEVDEEYHCCTREDGYHCQFTLEELKILEFPFKVGDIISIEGYEGEFVIYDYPWLDKRNVIREGDNIVESVMNYGNIYWVCGISPSGITMGTDYWTDNIEEEEISMGDSHHSKFKKVGDKTIFDYPENHPLRIIFNEFVREEYLKQ